MNAFLPFCGWSLDFFKNFLEAQKPKREFLGNSHTSHYDVTTVENGGKSASKENGVALSNNTPSNKPLQPKDILKVRLKGDVLTNHVVENTNNGITLQSMQNLSPVAIGYLDLEKSYSRSCDCIYQSQSDIEALERKARDMRRPLYRKDIFYSGSIANLKEFKVSNQDMTSIPDDVIPDYKTGCLWACARMCKSLTDTMKEMMDFSLMLNPVFAVYGLSCFLCMAGKQFCVVIPFFPSSPPLFIPSFLSYFLSFLFFESSLFPISFFPPFYLLFFTFFLLSFSFSSLLSFLPPLFHPSSFFSPFLLTFFTSLFLSSLQPSILLSILPRLFLLTEILSYFILFLFSFFLNSFLPSFTFSFCPSLFLSVLPSFFLPSLPLFVSFFFSFSLSSLFLSFLLFRPNVFKMQDADWSDTFSHLVYISTQS